MGWLRTHAIRTDAAASLVAQAAPRLIGFATFAILARTLPTHDFGVISAAYALGMSVAQGPASLDASYVALAAGAPTARVRLEIDNAYRSLTSASSLTLLLTGLALAYAFASRHDYIAWGMLMASGVVLYQNLPTKHLAARRYARMAVDQTGLSLALGISAIAAARIDGSLPVVVGCLIAAPIAASPFGYMAIGRGLPFSDRARIGQLARVTGWLALSTLLFAIGHRLELLLLASTDSRAAGGYAVALRVGSLVELAVAALGAIGVREYSRGKVSVWRDSPLMVALVMWSFVASLAAVAMAPILIRVMFGSSYATGSTTLAARILLASVAVTVPATLIRSKLVAKASTSRIAIASLFGVVAKILALMVLIEKLGVVGAAVAAVASQVAVLIALLERVYGPSGRRGIAA